VAVNKRSQVALAFMAGYLLLRIGIAIYRHPMATVAVFAMLTVFSVIGGASASDVIHAIFHSQLPSGWSSLSDWPARGVG
jgi:hypothetical protein